MAERKQPEVGEVYGEWTITAKAEPQGDRIRRWTLQNEQGAEMTVAQTSLKDLALAKNLKDRAQTRDAEAKGATKPLSALSAQIAASVIAANAEFKANENPFADMTPEVVETEDVIVESDNPFEISFIRATLLDPVDTGDIEGANEFVATWVAPRTTECEDAADVVLAGPGELPLPAGIVLTGSGAITTSGPGLDVASPWSPAPVATKHELQTAMDFVTKAKVQLNYAIQALEALL